MAFDQNKPANNAPLVSADVRNNLTHIKGAISKEHTWDDNNPANTVHRLDQINVTLSGSQQKDWAGTVEPGSRDVALKGALLTQVPGMPGGTYNLQSALQELVNRSHVHGVKEVNNCVCNCNTDH